MKIKAKLLADRLDVPLISSDLQLKDHFTVDRWLKRRKEENLIGYVAIFARDTKKRALFLRHSPETSWDPNKWALPGGGVLKEETFEDAAKREFLEETGLEVFYIKPIMVNDLQIFHQGRKIQSFSGVFFLAQLLENQVPKPGSEIREIQFFDKIPWNKIFQPEEIKALLKLEKKSLSL